MFTELTKKLDSFLEMGVPFYDCIVMKDGVCVYRHANGFTDMKNKVAVTGKEKYNIYSCSKLITCVAALQLWEK
jgi:CubicO group peptidase (beta-lactamase class C family)